MLIRTEGTYSVLRTVCVYGCTKISQGVESVSVGGQDAIYEMVVLFYFVVLFFLNIYFCVQCRDWISELTYQPRRSVV